MKQYIIDQLKEADYHCLKEHLDQTQETTMMEGIYRVDLPADLHTEIQREHATCQPYYFAIHLDFFKVSFELLVRTRQMLHCPCMGYADRRQRDYILEYADRLLEQLNIRA